MAAMTITRGQHMAMHQGRPNRPCGLCTWLLSLPVTVQQAASVITVEVSDDRMTATVEMLGRPSITVPYFEGG